MRSLRQLSVWCAGCATIFAILGTWYATWIAGLVDQANHGQIPWQPLMVPGIVGLVVIPLVWICILFIIVGWPAAAILTVVDMIRTRRAKTSEVDAVITRMWGAERKSQAGGSTFYR